MKLRLILLNLFVLILSRFYNCENEVPIKAIAFTVASSETDGYHRYMRSARHNKIPVTVLGLGVSWKGGDMSHVGGGYKLNLLREALRPYKDESDMIVMFTDCYDVVFGASMDTIIERFKKSGANMLFGAENYIWPDASLKDDYPPFDGPGGWYLNSGLFMGYADKIFECLKTPLKDSDDDQLYFTKIYLDPVQREKFKMKLDHKSEIFQNLNGALGQVKLQFGENGEAYVYNTAFHTRPVVIHGNGPSKLALNNFGNYLAGAFVGTECKFCEENKLKLVEDDLPNVFMALFVEKPTPFLPEFFDAIYELDYPKDSLHLFIYNNEPYHKDDVKKFIDEHAAEYKSFKFVNYEDDFNLAGAKNLAVTAAQAVDADYLFDIGAVARLERSSLRALLEANKGVIGPVMTRYNSMWSNFWGALNEDGFYARSHDYLDIIQNKIQGIYNVPYLTHAYLVKKDVLKDLNYDHATFEPDMAVCEHLRDSNHFMYVTNEKIYGHLVNEEDYDITASRPDFRQLFVNRHEWEKRYIRSDYWEQLNANVTPKQPCPDVYWFPVATDAFCDDLVAIVENFGQWSDGSNNDNRLQGGYEAVPTRDIHMNQVELERFWLHFLNLYVRPLQEKVFLGYYHDPVRSLMNFVVRYRPDEQPSLRPHHDSSTYTINLALNRVGVDYEGGGCRFLRYNCSVTDTQKGWLLMHPGRLTHFHEGLLTTKGTRYIMISFVDP